MRRAAAAVALGASCAVSTAHLAMLESLMPLPRRCISDVLRQEDDLSAPAFTNEQLVTIQTIASPLPLQLRSAFLEALAAQLGDRDVGDGELHRCALEARRLVPASARCSA